MVTNNSHEGALADVCRTFGLAILYAFGSRAREHPERLDETL
jgi:hypothetical protein